MRENVTYRSVRRWRCRDCGVAQGELHVEGCWREHCRQCGGQRVFCDCPKQIMRLPRVPFIIYANICGLCGRLNPEMFDVPNVVWRHYVEPLERDKMICEPCWHWLTEAIDHKRYATKYGDAVPLWSAEFRRRHGIPPDEPSPIDGSTV
jgi:hypothetical protein